MQETRFYRYNALGELSHEFYTEILTERLVRVSVDESTERLAVVTLVLIGAKQIFKSVLHLVCGNLAINGAHEFCIRAQSPPKTNIVGFHLRTVFQSRLTTL